MYCPTNESAIKPKRLVDKIILDNAKSFLRYHKETRNSKPFFLGVGIRKPHLPFRAPVEFANLYPLDEIKPVRNQDVPKNFPEIAYGKWLHYKNMSELAPYKLADNSSGKMPPEYHLLNKQMYLACVSYVDHLFGELINYLIHNGFGNNTIVLAIGDHGFQLGEHGGYDKHTNFDWATRAPWIMYHPRFGDLTKSFKATSALTTKHTSFKPVKVEVNQIVEFVDLYPTLVDAAGLPKLSKCQYLNGTSENLCTDGSSRWHLAQGLDVKTQSPDLAFSQVHRYA